MAKVPEDRAGSSVLAVAAQVLAMVSIIAGASIAKGAFPVVGPAGATTLRLAGGVIVLAIAMRPGRGRWRATATMPILFYGLAMGGMNLLFYLALAKVPLGIAIALELTGPLIVAILTSRSILDLYWLGLAVAGLLLVLPLGGAAQGIDPLGAVLALGAGACWALYIVMGKMAGNAHGAMTTLSGMTIAAIATAPAGIIGGGTALLRPEMLALGVAKDAYALAHDFEANRTAGLRRYTTSKLCNLFCTYELSRLLAASGNARLTSIKVNAIDPGLMPATGLARSWPKPLRWVSRNILPLGRFINDNVHSPQTSGKRLAAVTVGPEAKPGQRYFSNGKVVRSSDLSYDQDMQRELWNSSAKMTGLPIELSVY